MKDKRRQAMFEKVRQKNSRQQKLESWLQNQADSIEVMVFSGSTQIYDADGRPVDRTMEPYSEELSVVANKCVKQAPMRLINDAAFCDGIKRTLKRSYYTPLTDGAAVDRLPVQGLQASIGSREYQKREPKKISELLCLVRGPSQVGMDRYWIGIVRHDTTPYIVEGFVFLLSHVLEKIGRRPLLFARSTNEEKSYQWPKERVAEFNKLIHWAY